MNHLGNILVLQDGVIYKERVYSHTYRLTRGIWCLDGKERPFREVERVRSRHGSAEATQNKLVVCVVPFLPNRHVMDQRREIAYEV